MADDEIEKMTARVAAKRDEHLRIVRQAFAELGIVVVPRAQWLRIARSANDLAFGGEREGEHFAYSRPTVRKRGPFDDEPTPVVTARARVRRGR